MIQSNSLLLSNNPYVPLGSDSGILVPSEIKSSFKQIKSIHPSYIQKYNPNTLSTSSILRK